MSSSSFFKSSLLKRAGNFPAATTLFYSAEIVSALEYLHSLSIIYRWKNKVTPQSFTYLKEEEWVLVFSTILVLAFYRAAEVVAALQPGCEEMERE